MITTSDIEKDIDLMLWSAQLKHIYRYMNQKFWEEETAQHERAMQPYALDKSGRIFPRGESVAEHSWHMADIAMILAPRFPELDLGKFLQLAILHDKLEIITGDADPLGKDGTGKDTHAFNAEKRAQKDAQEKLALEHYKTMLNALILPSQEAILTDAMELNSPESRFIKAVDRLQPMTYVLRRKDGNMQDAHIAFSIAYTLKSRDYFPGITPYHKALSLRILSSIAEHRNIPVESLQEQLEITL